MNISNIYTTLLSVLVLGSVVVACNIFQLEETEDVDEIAGIEHVYAGSYTQGFEDSDFNPCFATDEVWQLTEIEDTTFLSKISGMEENPVYLEIRGIPSEPGEYLGIHLRQYDRQLDVKKVVAVSSLQENSCSDLAGNTTDY